MTAGCTGDLLLPHVPDGCCYTSFMGQNFSMPSTGFRFRPKGERIIAAPQMSSAIYLSKVAYIFKFFKGVFHLFFLISPNQPPKLETRTRKTFSIRNVSVRLMCPSLLLMCVPHKFRFPTNNKKSCRPSAWGPRCQIPVK